MIANKNFNLNPMQILNRFMPQITNNPMLSNTLQLAQKGDVKGVEQIARNFYTSQGKDFDTEFSKFMNDMKS